MLIWSFNQNKMINSFSVIIPAKGSCEYLIKTLESIIPSTLRPHQIILVDDGINVDIKSKVSELRSVLPIVLIPNSGKGLVDGLNTGLMHCETVFAARLDADDLITPERFQKQVDFLSNNTAVSAVGGQVRYIDANGLLKGASKYKVGRLDTSLDFKRECMLAHPAVMMRTELARKIGGYRSLCTNGRVDLAEDFDLWLRLAKVGEIHNLDETVLFYRQHPNQISTLHTPTQNFAAKYVAFVHKAEETSTDFKFRKLLLESQSSGFLLEAFNSLSGFVSFKARTLLMLEGSLIYFNVQNGLFPRVIRKIIRIFNQALT